MKAKKIVYMMIFVMSVLYCCGSIASGASDLQWGMSKADVIAIMGEGQTNLDKIVSAENETMSYYNQTISKFDGGVISLLFKNDQLYLKFYTLKESAGNVKYNYLLKALEDKYGTCGNNLTLLQKYLSSLSGREIDESDASLLVLLKKVKIATWSTEETDILLIWTIGNGKKDYGTSAIVYFPAGDSLPKADYKNDDL